MEDYLRYLVERPVICVVGPTASGKTDLAQELALVYDGEVVSADSMQIYRGMDIGTGKIPVEQRKVAHYGLDLLDPGEPYSAALFQPYARSCFNDISSREKRSVLAGGTGLYVRAAIDDYQFPKGEQKDNPIRDYYTTYAAEHGAQALWDLLAERDAQSAAVVHPNNIRRVVRAFELLEEGQSYARQVENLSRIEPMIPSVFIGLAVDPAILRERIDKRVDRMVSAGLVDEVNSLLNSGFRDGVTSPQAIGYKEIVEAIEGRINMGEAIQCIKTATHRYAKRQRTWFKKDERIVWLNADEGDLGKLVEEARSVIDAH